MNDKVKEVLDTILQQFKEGNIPKKVAIATFPTFDNPMTKWSFLNQLICYFSGSDDWRGFNQWKEVNRFVKKGAKATFILVPKFKKEINDKGEEHPELKGFMTAPVFKFEDTDGEELTHEKLELPELPLMDRARELGVDIVAVPGNEDFNGYYSRSKSTIALASPEFCVFAHELTHLADDKLNGLERKQDPIQEIVAELGAYTLCEIFNLDGSKHLGNHYKNIEYYAQKLDLTPQSAVMKVLSRTEKILKFLLKEEENVLA